MSRPCELHPHSPNSGNGDESTVDFDCHDCEVDEHLDMSSKRARKRLLVASLLCVAFMIAEAVGGILAGSLAILTDAAHLLSDLAGFLISVGALWLTSRKPTDSLSYGFHRAEILGALLSVFLIWAVTAVLMWEAVDRIKNPTPVDGKLMLIIAVIGFVINSIMAFVLHGSGHGHSHGGGHGHSHSHDEVPHFIVDSNVSINTHEHDDSHAPLLDEEHKHDHEHDHGNSHDHGHGHGHGHEENLNIRAAFIHVLGDMAQSIGVIIAAAIIWCKPEWQIVDPICTCVFAFIVLLTTFRLIGDSFHILMEGTPKHIDYRKVQQELSSLNSVKGVHDLHIWSITSGKPALSVHLAVEQGVDQRTVLRATQEMLLSKFKICHSTIQIDSK
jgi:solute carrier family 30 (zinc transporter), member 2